MEDNKKRVTVPLTDEDARSLKAGDYVYLNGTVYSARDAAHKRMQEALDAGKSRIVAMSFCEPRSCHSPLSS